MRHLILAAIITLTCVINNFAQTTPKTPQTPNTSSSTSTSYSISISGDEDDNEFSGTSVSIKKSESIYKFRATFNKRKTNEVKDILIKKLGSTSLKTNKGSYSWVKNENGKEVLECKLTKGNLKLIVNKDFASSSFMEMINNLGIHLKDYISGSDSKKERKKDIERAAKDLERAKQDLKRAEEDLERAKKDLERTKKTN